MAAKTKTHKQSAIPKTEIDELRTHRRTFKITQKGIRTSEDLWEFHSGALADIDAGRADVKEMALMASISRQILAHENLKYKIGLYRTAGLKGNGFFPLPKPSKALAGGDLSKH